MCYLKRIFKLFEWESVEFFFHFLNVKQKKNVKKFYFNVFKNVLHQKSGKKKTKNWTIITVLIYSRLTKKKKEEYLCLNHIIQTLKGLWMFYKTRFVPLFFARVPHSLWIFKIRKVFGFFWLFRCFFQGIRKISNKKLGHFCPRKKTNLGKKH